MTRTSSLIDDLEAAESESAVAMATLISASGSSSKKIGARMLVGRSGRLLGGVTIGGCVDAQVIEAADALLDSGSRRLLAISLDDDEAWEIGLTCGGTVEVMLDRVAPADAADPLIAAHAVVSEVLARDESAVMVTTLDGPAAALVVTEDGVCRGTLGSDERDVIAAEIADQVSRDGSRVETIAGERYFFERHAPPTTLVIIGAGQIAMALTNLSRELEMRSIVIDGRDRYATRERFPAADEIHIGMPSEIVAGIPATRRVAVVLVAHDYKYDVPVLRHYLRAPVGYIGLLGSRKRGAAVRELLRDEGFSDDDLARMHTPIGLEIGGKSSPEVALSILAEIVAVRNGKRS